MLNLKFQKLSIKERQETYGEIKSRFASLTSSSYPNIYKNIHQGNNTKVDVMIALINQKTDTSLSWEDCFNTLEQNL